jgi:hypothetical protein
MDNDPINVSPNAINANGTLKYLVSLNSDNRFITGINEIRMSTNPDKPKINNGFFSTAIFKIVEKR